MNFDFTGGDWYMVEKAGLIDIKPQPNGVYDDGSTPSICSVWKHDKNFPDIYHSMNDARLIVCAPELLKALIDDIGLFEDMRDLYPDKKDFFQQIIDIKIKHVKKATGKKWSEII